MDKSIEFTSALQLVYMDNNLSFEDLLKKSVSVSIQNKNLQQLAVEIYKALNNLSSSLMSELFRVKETKYSLQIKIYWFLISLTQQNMV